MDNKEINLDKILTDVCKDFHIKITNSRYYINESTYYEFDSEDDMMLALSSFQDRLLDERCAFKIAVRNDPDNELYSIELFLEV